MATTTITTTTIVFVLLVLSLTCVQAYLGVDVSTPVTVDQWECLASAGNTRAVVRVFHSYGAPDNDSIATIQNAHTANIDIVDIYMFPCIGNSSVKAQFESLVDFLNTNNIQWDNFWLDIEVNPSDNCGWSPSNYSYNCLFLNELLDTANEWLLKPGVYSSERVWGIIFNNDCFVGSYDVPLWYPRYDFEQNFDDFVAFGGWTSPIMKQYNGSVELCDGNVDLDYYYHYY
eukprot:TRINITY_DN1470_c0_g1_i3.p1 TRINITY_DN1470_c0_g1~~TRINITY_DN1470_c0_g1_i3.p1  ORF type:complete len:230 (-),score=34.04 TRINITY_DN1470_c0_g1_i3:139-828(-)